MDRNRRDFLSATAAAMTLSAGLPAALAKGDPPPAPRGRKRAPSLATPRPPKSRPSTSSTSASSNPPRKK